MPSSCRVPDARGFPVRVHAPGADHRVCSFFRVRGHPLETERAGRQEDEGGLDIAKPSSTPQTRVNFQIRIPQIRVIDEEGEQLGIMDTRDALELAQERGLDLVEVAPTARPPVCRIMDYGRFRYEESKKQKKAKSKQHQQRVKVIKFRPKTEDHDYQFKKRHILEFLEAGDKVKVIVQFRGREMAHQERGMMVITRLLEDLDEAALVADPPKMEGNTLSLMLMPPTRKK